MREPVWVPTGSVFVDASTSPQTSPTASSANEIALVFPPTSRFLTFRSPSSNGVIRAVSGGATGGTYPYDANVDTSLTGLPGDTVYIKPTGATVTYFRFSFERVDNKGAGI